MASMKFEPRPFQRAAIQHAYDFLTTAPMGAKQLYAAPTGVGKSVVQLGVRVLLDDLWIVTPRDEIIHGMLDKLQQPDADPLDMRITTPVKLRNRLIDGRLRHPKHLLFDETHHHNASVWQQLDLLSGICPSVGYTATPYRGTPKSTREFRETWGEPLWLITYAEAVAMKYITMPTFDILPLVDDDVVEVSGGDFDVTSIESATVDRIGDLAEHARQWYKGGKWDKPTIFALPSSGVCRQLSNKMLKLGLPCCIVSASTPKGERQQMFDLVERGIFALLHINIVSEGVDLKLRRLVDAAPTLSPVKWAQQLGRIMRPWDDTPEYICCNRNIMRHAYILEDVVPAAAVIETERKFGPTTRPHTRVLGLEAIGRFKPATTKLLNGGNLHTYLMSVLQGNTVVEYCCLVHPVMNPIWAVKVNTKKEDGTKDWGTWMRCNPPEDLRGFASKGAKEPSEKQQNWWNKSAAHYGLDPDQELTRRSFVALPVLKDIGERMR